jgi:hypothetical protein
MSLVFDAKSITVDGGTSVDVDLNVASIEINAALPVTEVSVEVPNATQTVQVEVPGMRGPAGVKNVYIQPNNPAVEFGWGPEETNYVWIPTA